MSAKIRKLIVSVEETHEEGGKSIAPPTRKACALAVIENPFAGRHVADLAPLIAIGEELGGLLGQRAVAALGIEPGRIESYGKPMDWVSGISTDESNLKYWSNRAETNSLHPKSPPARKVPSPPRAIESGGVGKWR